MKILVIEDEKILADSIKAMLQRNGFQVECVYDGESGKEYAELGIYIQLLGESILAWSAWKRNYICCNPLALSL